MHDIRLLRDDPQAFDAAMARRGVAAQASELLELDRQHRETETNSQNFKAWRNKKSAEVGKAKAQGNTALADQILAEIKAQAETAPDFEDSGQRLFAALAALPNRPDADVPNGADESGNVELSRWGTPRVFAFAPREHADFGPALGLDFATGAAISGARFTFLRGHMARLNRALGQFMLDAQVAAGFTECAPPLLVREESLFGTGQLPKFGEDNFQTTDGRWLIPTAEVSLTNAVREQILAADALPLRMTALTPCFRSEAGAAGKDTRGFIRQHQFEKVELVTVCRPEDSNAEHEAMCVAAEAILRALELPYRKMLLCAGDMGFTARKTYDLEVWLPGQDAYREISSVSNCGEFQARRMNARYRGDDGKPALVHTLNGSGLAVGRTLVAVIETYQNEDGSVDVPTALRPYMGGIERLTPA
ncbi:MAG TPA: serine--tRNA ligase [Novosphingobium sp.]|nr:serine--tRNA ligase [Novosphingobium sp.]